MVDITIFAGATIVGKIESMTLTIWVAVAVFPLASVTVQVTVVVPAKNSNGALFVTLATLQLSAVIGVPKTTPAAPQDADEATVIAAGAIIVGFIASTTVINWLTEVEFPLESITVQTTVVVPNK